MENKKYLQTKLRNKAEIKSLKEPALNIDVLKSMSLNEIAEKMHELSVYQIELEMQNEELHKTQEELYHSKKCYFELYDMAPMGYLTLNSDGLILEANLESSQILATSRKKLINQSFTNFIYSEDQDIYYMLRKKIVAFKKRQICELRMRNSAGEVFWTQITVNAKSTSSEHFSWKVIFSNISESRELRAIKEHNEILHNFSRKILQARENERKSIAREVHDQLGQIMTALKIDLLWLKRKIPQDAYELMTKVDIMLGNINLGIQSVRGIVVQLRPLILDDLGLEAAMEWYVGKYLKSANVNYNISFKCEESIFNEDLKIVLFRIFQEALTNVIHHSNATKCSISLIQKDETLILQITDNGIGVTLEQIENPKSFGLIGIRERLYPYVGRLSVIGNNGTGTTLTIKIENFKEEIIDD
jgi:PAS domain S-box-containing protein